MSDELIQLIMEYINRCTQPNDQINEIIYLFNQKLIRILKENN